MTKFVTPGSNQFLARLTLAEQRRLYPGFELVVLKPGAVISEPFEAIRFAYFPVDCIISVLFETQDGNSVEREMIGREGVFGTSLLLGGAATACRAVVQCAGHAYRLDARSFIAEFMRHQNLHDLLLRYIHTIIVQVSQIAICNRHHTVDQQLCRWLLSYLDRIDDDCIHITHQRIADMLGVRREGVTLAARKLQQQGVIAYQRGAISIRQRDQLERLSCECYAVLDAESQQLRRFGVVHAACSV